jgi:hypothetical protein
MAPLVSVEQFVIAGIRNALIHDSSQHVPRGNSSRILICRQKIFENALLDKFASNHSLGSFFPQIATSHEEQGGATGLPARHLTGAAAVACLP